MPELPPLADLSILICHLRQRSAKLQRLQKCLQPQVALFRSRVEVLVHTDQGQLSVGEKRNLLVERAKGRFTCFIDDDDLVSDDYLVRILGVIAENPTIDCIGLEGIVTFGGEAKVKPRRFVHSARYTSWYTRDGVYYRNPNHLNPIRTDIVKKVAFPHKDHGEDVDWSMLVRPQLKKEGFLTRDPREVEKEVMLEGPIYFYESRDSGNGV